MAFALAIVPMILAVGAGIDYVRAYNIRVKMQSDLDAALLAAIKEVDTLEEDDLQEKVAAWFDAQTDLDSTKYSLVGTDITVSKTDKTIEAVASSSVETTFMKIANIETVPVAVQSSVAGPATAYLNVYIVLDKSASMLLPATETDRKSLFDLVYKYSYDGKSRAYMSCEFACHEAEGSIVFKYRGKTYGNIYDFISTQDITLRTDVALSATDKVLDMIDDADADHDRIKIGLYGFGDSLSEAIAPTFSTTTAAKALTEDKYNLTSATSQSSTYFNDIMEELEDVVGIAGDGTSAGSPLKLVLFLTDGVQSTRSWVTSGVNWTWGDWDSDGVSTPKSGASWHKVAPMNPAWCDSLKTNGVTVGVLNTEYLEIPYDWGYQVTLDATMASADWKSTWGGAIRSDVATSTTRHDYLEYALKDCATSEDLFLSASDSDEIEEGLSTLFEQYLTNVRLTQ
ncbi:pilus assembly protein TadG-related protein [Rhizobium sp. TRM95111]|uniref:TadE/TadG family type IV pilus assembly protein n=1 Tax=Rhizobium alarense TaxID=2846851 RepID=UPI001F273971|nr:pilus assembly protein TadG-related protein [Rhizobium alarense]MCF3642783.1 pilus assembly protein TadG-related protein [Rhizobium alarense]